MPENLQPMWTPSQDRIASSLLAKFISDTSEKSGNTTIDYDAVWEWSVSSPDQFWDALWDSCGIVGDKTGLTLTSEGHLIDAQFYPDAKINYAENLLAHPGLGPTSRRCRERTDPG